MLVANARMYSPAAGAAMAWRDLFRWLAGAADVPLEIVEHAPPAPLADLWARRDLGACFMCGWPLAKRAAKVRPLAAPVMNDPHAQGRAVYWTDFVVRFDSDFAARGRLRRPHRLYGEDIPFGLQRGASPPFALSRSRSKGALQRGRGSGGDAARRGARRARRTRGCRPARRLCPCAAATLRSESRARPAHRRPKRLRAHARARREHRGRASPPRPPHGRSDRGRGRP